MNLPANFTFTLEPVNIETGCNIHLCDMKQRKVCQSCAESCIFSKLPAARGHQSVHLSRWSSGRIIPLKRILPYFLNSLFYREIDQCHTPNIRGIEIV